MVKSDFADVVVVGAGPAGLFAAILLAGKGLSVTVLEKNSFCGKKFLLSGSGRCNITNSGEIEDFLHHYGDNGKFVKPSLYSFPPSELITFFERRGIAFIEMNDGKIFPSSQRSRDLLDVLLASCAEKNVKILLNHPVKKIIREAEYFLFSAEKEVHRSRFCIIAAGGKSYPVTGSNGDGCRLAEMLIQPVTEQRPSLSPVYVRKYSLSECAGISVENVKISVVSVGKKTKSSEGDILFTHKGLSGPGILNLARFISPGDVVKISFTGINEDEFDKNFSRSISENGRKTVKNIISEIIPEKLSAAVCRLCGCDIELKAALVDKNMRRKISSMLCSMDFVVDRLGSFDEAMATCGGVALDGVNPKTMESRMCENLFFAGEVLDVDGDTGGYNLQFAFSSAHTAAEALFKKHSASGGD